MSRLNDALRVLLGKCTPAGTQPVGDKVDDFVECLAGHYQTCSIFYGNIADNYLYTDKKMTVKATKTDIENAVMKGAIYVVKSDSAVYYAVNYARVIAGEKYAQLALIPYGEEYSVKYFYTAEWAV